MNEANTTPAHVSEYDVKQTGQLIRKRLRETFKGTKFSVRMSRGTGYGTYYVNWTDGPTQSEVNEVIEVFNGADFNGMDDSTSYRGFVPFEGGLAKFSTKYVLTQRSISDEFRAKVKEDVIASDAVDQWGARYSQLCPIGQSTLVHQHAHQRSA